MSPNKNKPLKFGIGVSTPPSNRMKILVFLPPNLQYGCRTRLMFHINERNLAIFENQLIMSLLKTTEWALLLSLANSDRTHVHFSLSSIIFDIFFSFVLFLLHVLGIQVQYHRLLPSVCLSLSFSRKIASKLVSISIIIA